MVDREKVLTILRRRFPEASFEVVATAANAIVGLSDEWQELTECAEEVAAHLSAPCGESCGLQAACGEGAEFRVFRRLSA